MMKHFKIIKEESVTVYCNCGSGNIDIEIADDAKIICRDCGKVEKINNS